MLEFLSGVVDTSKKERFFNESMDLHAVIHSGSEPNCSCEKGTGVFVH